MKKKWGTSPAARLFDLRAISRTRGKATCQLQICERHINIFSHAHGGVLCALADETMGKAFLSLLPKNQSGVTVELKVQFIRPVLIHTILCAKARVTSQGKTLSFLECEIYGLNRKLVAKATATLMVKRMLNDAKQTGSNCSK